MARADHRWMTIRKLVRAAGDGYAYDPGSLYDKIQRSESLDPLPLRLLSMAGGILSAAALTGFIFISGILQDGLPFMITGITFLLLSILLPFWRNSLALDTFAVAMQALGLVLTAIGLTDIGWTDMQIAISFGLIGIITVMVTRSKTQTFTSVLLVFCSMLFVMEDAGWHDGLHLYNLITVPMVTGLMLRESQVLAAGGRILWLYLPSRNATIIATAIGYLLLAGGDNAFWPSPRWTWISFLPVAAALLILLRHVSIELPGTDLIRRRKWMIALLVLTLPTAFYPAIAASLLIMLLGFYAGHRSAFVLGAIGLPVFIGMWYHDLPISLLQKSIWMILSGVACMLTYLFLIFTNKEDAEG